MKFGQILVRCMRNISNAEDSKLIPGTSMIFINDNIARSIRF